MPALHILGNCQVQTIEFLAQNMLPEFAVKGLDFSDPSHPPPDVRRAFRDDLKNADYIIVQPGGPDFLHHQSIKQDFPGKTFVMANFYFRGLHPDNCYVGSIADRFQNPTLYHSVAVLDAFRQGRPEKWAVKEALTLENFARLGLLDAWDSSIDEMRKRDAQVDLPAADLIDGFCREFPGFLAMNHPVLALMHQYITAVFDRMGLRHRFFDVSVVKDPLAMHDICPVLDDVAEHYHLPYRTTQRWMLNHLGKRFVDREEFIRRFYAEYAKADVVKLTVHSPLDMLESLKRNPKLHHLIAFSEME